MSGDRGSTTHAYKYRMGCTDSAKPGHPGLTPQKKNRYGTKASELEQDDAIIDLTLAEVRSCL